jgi:hypothetical protein
MFAIAVVASRFATKVMNMKKRRLVWVALGTIGVSAFAAIVVPKSAWEILMQEVSSDHNVSWQGDAKGQPVATGNQPPDQSYKPLLPNPGPPIPQGKAPAPPLGIGQPGSDISGSWDITIDDNENYEKIRVWADINPDGTTSYHCISVTEYGDGIRLNDGSEKGDCSVSDWGDNRHFAMNMGPPPGKGACDGNGYERFYAPARFRPIHFQAAGPGRYEDKSEHSFACNPRDDQTKIQTITVQVVGNSLSGVITDVGIPLRCNPDCDNAPHRISGTRVTQ